MQVVHQEYVKPEPEGTIVLLAFRVASYTQDADGSAMAVLEQIDVLEQASTGWRPNCIGLYPESGIVVTEEELQNIVRDI